ncbi:GH43 family beta-xylosidase [Haloferula luteola]|uniref:GH43 family beta-xylosidase n=1 Tax=Haloferula luteola TaxID=595692 RepID=A0A840UW94_9BACT|nr:family 43 glycosylhydrolase [Haloferula luteola]MBB5350437.1 GH43 family beta-xylosidase [Haloferula luteola]
MAFPLLHMRLFPLALALSLILPAPGAWPYLDPLTHPSADHWELVGGDWSADQGSLDVDPGAGALAHLKGLEVNDFQLDLEIKADARSEVGVIFRGQKLDSKPDAYEGGEVRIHPGENTIYWDSVAKTRKPIAHRPLPIESDQWYHLRIQAAAERVRIYLESSPITSDSWPIFDGVEASFTKGDIALKASGDQASFRNLELREIRSRPLSDSFTNPVQEGGADPVVLHDNGKYYAYTTHTARQRGRTQGIRLHTSTDLVHWKDEGFALKDRDSWGDHGFWAPDIVEKDGTFYLYYAAQERICVATSNSPMGPFRQKTKEPMAPDSIKIDAHVFEDDDGQCYFYYVSFGQGNEIWGGKLNDDMVSVDPSSLRKMLGPDEAWERHQAPVTEGPEMIKHQGIYYLTYSGSHFAHPEYAVGYATSDSPLGPWKKYAFNPVMKSTSYARGTAHHCFIESPDGKEIFIVYHRHQSFTQVSPRNLAIDRVRFVPDPAGGPDILQIHGPTSTPQPMPSGAH